jgi:hypothetical protein
VNGRYLAEGFFNMGLSRGFEGTSSPKQNGPLLVQTGR